MTTSPNIIGLGAGLVAAVLFASLGNFSVLALLLFYVVPLPLFLAGVGWGMSASILSVASATALIILLQNFLSATSFLILIGAPCVFLSYLFLTRREFVVMTNDGGQEAPQTFVEWYPFGRLIAWASVMAGIEASILIFVIGGGDSEAYRNAVISIFNEESLKFFQDFSGPEFGLEQLRALAERVALYILPSTSAALWLAVIIGNLWLAAKSAAISGLLLRPLPVFATITFPPFLVAGFGAAFLASLMSGMPALIGTAFVGAFGFAFILLGLTVIHALLRNSPFRIPALIAVYFGLFVTPWVSPPVMGLGLIEPFLRLRARKANQPPSPGNHPGPNS